MNVEELPEESSRQNIIEIENIETPAVVDNMLDVPSVTIETLPIVTIETPPIVEIETTPLVTIETPPTVDNVWGPTQSLSSVMVEPNVSEEEALQSFFDSRDDIKKNVSDSTEKNVKDSTVKNVKDLTEKDVNDSTEKDATNSSEKVSTEAEAMQAVSVDPLQMEDMITEEVSKEVIMPDSDVFFDLFEV